MQFPDFGILYIDDEEKSLKYFEAIFEDMAKVYVACSPEEGFRIFSEHHDRIGLVLSDKKMPNESGIDLLARIREVDSRPLRMLVTAYSDLNLAVDAFNDGRLYSYLSKPWEPAELGHQLIRALRHFCLEWERKASRGKDRRDTALAHGGQGRKHRDSLDRTQPPCQECFNGLSHLV